MKGKLIILMILSMFMFSGCSFWSEPNTNINIDNGVVYDEQGNPINMENPFPTQIFDSSGTSNVIGTFGEQWAADIKNDVLVKFIYGLSFYDVTNNYTGTGYVGTANNMGYVSTGNGSTAYANIHSINSIRYRPGHTALGHFTAMFEDGCVVNVTQRAGLFNGENGMFLGCEGEQRVVGFLTDGVVTYYNESDWNGDERVHDYNWSNLNVFRIKFGWLGIAPINYQVLLPNTSEWVDIHTIRLQGIRDQPHIGNPSMPVQIAVNKTNGDATDVTIRTGSWQAGVIGLCQICGNRPFALSANKTLTATTDEQAVMFFRSPAIFNGKSNKIRAKLNRYQFFVDTPATGDGTIIFNLRRVQYVDGTPNWINVSTGQSVIQYSLTGTYNSTGQILGFTEFNLYDAAQGSSTGIAGGTVINADQYGLYLDPNGIYALTAQTTDGTALNVRFTFNWEEQQ